MFFVMGKYHPLPQSFVKKSKPYDIFVLRHRLVEMYNGYLAFFLGLYWYVASNDRTCSKKIDTIELIMIASTAAHFTWDLIYMKYHGILEMGNLIHHTMGISSYYMTFY